MLFSSIAGSLYMTEISLRGILTLKSQSVKLAWMLTYCFLFLKWEKTLKQTATCANNDLLIYQQDEKNQVLTTNIWLQLVRSYFLSVKVPIKIRCMFMIKQQHAFRFCHIITTDFREILFGCYGTDQPIFQFLIFFFCLQNVWYAYARLPLIQYFNEKPAARVFYRRKTLSILFCKIAQGQSFGVERICAYGLWLCCFTILKSVLNIYLVILVLFYQITFDMLAVSSLIVPFELSNLSCF